MINGLYNALSGMNAQRRILDVTAHNIANQATDGFHRQRVELKAAGIGNAARVFAGEGSQLRGVDVTAVTRVVDQLAEDRLVLESARSASANAASADLDRIEQAFPEPSENGLGSMFDDFWAGWSDLSLTPGDPAARVQTLERATTLADGLHRAVADLDRVADTASAALGSLADEVNDLAVRIAELNGAIGNGGVTANDLADQRDVLLRELSDLTGAIARPASGGAVNVSIGGSELVSGSISRRVQAVGGTLTWERSGAPVAAPASKAAALMNTVSNVVPRYRAALDDIASTLVTEVNNLHVAGFDQSGTTGRNFFDPAGVTAATIGLSADVAGAPGNIAAGQPVLPGPTAPGPLDGEQARAIAAIADQINGPGNRYRTMVAELGIEVRSASRNAQIQSDVVQSAEARAQSVGGVSLDEEMVNLMASQRAYEASARVLTAVDDMLGILIERTGRAGR